VLALFIIAVTWAKIPGIDRLGKAGLVVASTGMALLSMFVGATGPLMSVILAQILSNDRKALVATHAAAMTVQHGLKIVVFGLAGFAFSAWLPLIAVMIASGFLGTVYGTRLLERLPEASFRRWFRIGITILALDLLWQGLDAAF
jgi:uncharacterized membrane protein YfcA